MVEINNNRLEIYYKQGDKLAAFVQQPNGYIYKLSSQTDSIDKGRT